VTADRARARPPEPAAPEAGGPPWLNASIPDEVVLQSVDAVILTDPDLRVRVWNPAAERLYGIPASLATGQLMGDIVGTFDLDGAPIDSAVARVELEKTGVWRRRVIHRPIVGAAAGAEVFVDSIVTILRGPDGGSIGALGVNRDVTDSARLEAEMAALGTLVVATDRARSKAEVADAALGILCRSTGADAGLVTSMGKVYEATAHVGVRSETIEVIVNFGQLGGPLAHALRAPNAFVSADVATAPLREDVRTAVLADGIEHLVVVGLRLSGRLTGILALGWRVRSPREPSRAIVHQAAALIAAAMENARLLEAVESGLREERMLTHRMRALVELTRLPDTAGSGPSSLERLMADLDEVIGGDGTSLVSVVDDHLVLTAVHRVDPAWAVPLMNRPLSALPIAARLLDGAQTVLVPLDPGHVSTVAAEASATQGYRALVAFAIRDENALVAILIAMFRRPVDELEIDERTLDAIGRVLDISFANRRLREAIVAGERRYRELFEYAPDALLVQSLDDVILDANPAAHRMYGEGLIGSRAGDLAVTPPVPAPTEADGQADVGSSIGIGRRLDGSTFPEEVELRMVEIDGERRVMAIVRDLTERSRLQGELIQAQKMEAIGLLVAGVAHELNNPLAAIVAFSQLIRTDPGLPTDLRSQADMLVQEANRTRVIVQNLLDFARQRPPERVRTELRPLVDSILGLQSYVLHRNRLTVEVDIPDDLPPLLVDRSQLQQVLINLTVNSAQAIRETGRPGAIRIEARASTSAAGPTVRITIADDGPGIPDAILGRLFMPFVTTKEPGAGTGLGLSVSFGIIASHGGTLRHEPGPDRGATFVIELPVGADEDAVVDPADAPTEGEAGLASAIGRAMASPPAATADAPSADADPLRSVAASGEPIGPQPATDRPIKVLVLDDEPSIRDFLGRVLRRSGYLPILAATGAAALEAINDDPPDAILCDHRMAGMSGTEFHAAVAGISPILGRRFAFMSGDVLNPELREFAQARGVHLLAKPFDIATVGSIVSDLLAIEPD
jgi:PAS domain S-box-containing protein